jgi:response regulator RpfG family c-di-GMP phosphodiesterase
MSEGFPRVLIVDDEPTLLEGIQRNLGRKFQFQSAVNGTDALELVRLAEKPFEVIMSDFRMPDIDGVTLLRRVRELAPDTVRILLTGQWDTTTAINAVNEGNVFRFLTKPCPMNTVSQTLTAGAELYRLVTAERVLLEQTLRGCIQTLVRILSLASPEAFGRANRVKRLVLDAAAVLKLTDTWILEVAAMLSQIGTIILPPDTAGKVHRGESLSAEERVMVERLPAASLELIADIPRLDAVREILKWHTKNFDGTGSPASEKMKGRAIPVGARILKAALDYDIGESTGATDIDTITLLRGRTGWYDPEVLDALAASGGIALPHDVCIKELSLSQLRPGMMLIADVRSKNQMLLVARGHVVTYEMMERLRNIGSRMGVQEPLRCRVG